MKIRNNENQKQRKLEIMKIRNKENQKQRLKNGNNEKQKQ